MKLSKGLLAIAVPARRTIVTSLVARGPLTVSEITKTLGVSMPAALKHLRTLEAVGIVSRKKKGRVVTISIRRAAIVALAKSVTALADG